MGDAERELQTTPTREEYLMLAEQCEARAARVGAHERTEYLTRAALWRRLAEGRLPGHAPNHHFPIRSLPNPTSRRGRST